MTWFETRLVLTVIVLIAAVVLLARRQRWSALFVAATASVGGLVNSGVKEFVRWRPQWTRATQRKVFSGHALSSTVVYGVLLVVFLPVVPKLMERGATTHAHPGVCTKIVGERPR